MGLDVGVAKRGRIVATISLQVRQIGAAASDTREGALVGGLPLATKDART